MLYFKLQQLTLVYYEIKVFPGRINDTHLLNKTKKHLFINGLFNKDVDF